MGLTNFEGYSVADSQGESIEDRSDAAIVYAINMRSLCGIIKSYDDEPNLYPSLEKMKEIARKKLQGYAGVKKDVPVRIEIVGKTMEIQTNNIGWKLGGIHKKGEDYSFHWIKAYVKI